MDNTKIYQTQHHFECGEGKANLNIFNGRLLYNYPIMQIGNGLLGIQVGLTYNSEYNLEDFDNKKIGFGNGWKYSFEEYLFPYSTTYNIEGFNNGDYVYIDSNWCIHRFVKYRTESENGYLKYIYYDTSGSGLKLIIKGNEDPTIYDELFNSYRFKEEKLCEVKSGINDSNIKKIEYDESYDKVVSVYNSYIAWRKIKFNYNHIGLPVMIFNTVDKGKVYYEFEYEGTKLSKIYKLSDTNKKAIHQFMYNDYNLVRYVINCENLEALEFNYDVKNNRYVVSEVLVGAMTKGLEKGTDEAEIYCGENNCLDDGSYVSAKGVKKNNEELILIDKYIKSKYIYDYQTSHTDVTTIKKANNITIRYYFDTLGKLISNLEYKRINDIDKYYTTSMPKGQEIKINGTSNMLFNDKQVKVIDKNSFNNTFKYRVDVPPRSLGELVSYLYDSFEIMPTSFIVSFWLMFEHANDTTLTAKLKYELDGEERYGQTIISKTLGKVWQLVNIKLDLREKNKILYSLALEIDVDPNSVISNNKIYIADVRINPGDTATICINNTKEGENTFNELRLGSKIYYYEGTEEKEATISADFYLTEKDVTATYRSIFYDLKRGHPDFDLYYCNKTKVKSVCYISTLPSTDSEHKYYLFGFRKYKSDESSYYDGIPNYHFRYRTLTDLSMGANTYTIKEIQPRYYGDVNNNYYETKTIIGTNTSPNYDDNKRLLETELKMINCVWQNKNGTIKGTKYSRRSTSSDPNINIITENSYDALGNLIETKTYEGNNEQGEEITKRYTYDSLNEKVIEIEQEDTITKYEYDNHGNVTKMISGNHNMLFNYNEFNELTEICFLDNLGNIINKNIIQYNKKGQMNVLKDENNVAYGYLYNALSEVCEVYCNSDILEKYAEDQVILYQDENKKYIHKSQYDQYGKILEYKIENNTSAQIIKYIYENNNALSYSRISKIEDPFTNGEITYEYTEDPEYGTDTIITDTSNHFQITNKAEGSNKYNIENDSIANKLVVKIDNENNNNNIKYSYNYLCDKENGEENQLKYYSFDYDYDHIGRLKVKKYQPDEYAQAIINISKNFEYKPNTNLVKTISYKVNSRLKEETNTEATAELIYENTSSNGNVIKIIERGNRFITNPKNEASLGITSFGEKITEYEYDECNRLTKEVRPNGDIYEYVYGDTSHMIENIKKNDTIIKSFEYNHNRLTRINENGIITNIRYDKYGNTIQTNKATITYNSRNLMESYETNNNEKYIFTYNYQGIRYRKEKENGYKVNYYLDGTRIIGEDLIDNDNHIIRKFRYYYDIEGICGIDYIVDDNNDGKLESHYYNLIKDSSGNIAKIMYRGKYIGEYTYDAWGNCEINYLSSANELDEYVINNNPFRYKGYYYDVETNLALVSSRYYSPELGRFIQPADVSSLNPQSINGLNLYTYAVNNPIAIKYDSSVSSYGSGMVSSFMGNGVVSGGYPLSVSNAFSVKFPKQNWLSTSADFVASMAGAISVINWTSKNPQFFEFFNYNYGITKHQMLNNLKSPLVKAAKWLSYGIVAYETYDDIKGHIHAGDSWQTTVSSGIVTAGVGAFNVWAAGEIGAAIGGAIGGVPGFIIGTVAGVVVGVIINGIFYTEINGKSIASYIEDGIEGLLEWLF